MATSGTTTFDLDFTELADEAWARCGAEIRSGYDLRTTRISLNLLFAAWANQGLNLWTIDSGTIAMVAGTATYVLPADTVDLMEYVIRTGAGSVSTQADLSMQRISASTYAAIPNKLSTGRPLQLWIQRLIAPQITVWPVPDAASTYTLVYWRLRRIQDAGATTQDVPYRFLPALVAGLAYYLALKIPGGIDRLPVLQQQYQESWQAAMDEDREKATLRLVPRTGRI